MTDSMKGLLTILVTFVVGIFVGWGLDYAPDDRTCESAARHNLALRQCLEFRPSCTSATVEDFVVYHDNKDWIEANCPRSYSGDDFLSQDNR